MPTIFVSTIRPTDQIEPEKKIKFIGIPPAQHSIGLEIDVINAGGMTNECADSLGRDFPMIFEPNIEEFALNMTLVVRHEIPARNPRI